MPRRPKRAKKPSKRIVIIAGPNGAGKTTFAEQFLTREAKGLDFINADLIARGLSPFAPETAAIRAARIMLSEIDRRVRNSKSFAFETTLAGLGYANHIREWRALGYHVKLIFLRLPSVELALQRVRARVAQGGHNIPEEVVRRRFESGLRNLQDIYHKLVNVWLLYDYELEEPRYLKGGHRK
jgi:predicted ABC-type ATPase